MPGRDSCEWRTLIASRRSPYANWNSSVARAVPGSPPTPTSCLAYLTSARAGGGRRWYAPMLIDRDGPGDRAKARELLTEAIAMYRQIGMPKHVEMAETMLREVERPQARGPDHEVVGE